MDASWLSILRHPLLAFSFGAITGVAEIASRYRDEPILATRNRYGLSYILLNGAVALSTYAALRAYGDDLLPKVAADPFLAAMAAGFGSMALLRSSFFSFRTEDGKEYPIGPAIVIDAFRQMLDRKIDRLRASARQQLVFEKMKDIHSFEEAARYLEASLLSFQNLGLQEKADIAEIIDDYRKLDTWPQELRTMAIGFAFLTIAGEENFNQVIENLKKLSARVAGDDQGNAPAPGPQGP